MPDHLYDPPVYAEPAGAAYGGYVSDGGGGGGAGYGEYHVSDPPLGEPAPPAPPAPPAAHIAAHPSAAEAGPNVHDPFGLGAGHLTTTPLLDAYRGEQHGTNEPGHMPTNMGGMDTPVTAYAASAVSHRATIADGQLHRAGGEVADSSAAQPMWKKDKAERFNFAMDGHGDTYLSDPRSEFLALRNERRDAGETTTGRINHSTMVAGGDVAGAGTMRVRDGKVESLGDGSGHYQPAVTQTAQVAEELASRGVMDPARSSVELTGKGGGQKDLTLSTQELLSYGDQFSAAKASFAATGDKSALAAPEAQIRSRHAAKDAMQAELLGRVGAGGGAAGALAQMRSERAPHVYDQVAEGHLYDQVAEQPAASHYDHPYGYVPEGGGGGE